MVCKVFSKAESVNIRFTEDLSFLDPTLIEDFGICRFGCLH
jgi:hypothetical protein